MSEKWDVGKVGCHYPDCMQLKGVLKRGNGWRCLGSHRVQAIGIKYTNVQFGLLYVQIREHENYIFIDCNKSKYYNHSPNPSVSNRHSFFTP